jgi:hypothetical protein
MVARRGERPCVTSPAHWEAATRQADPPADRAVAALIGPWSEADGAMGPGLARLAQATRLMAGWTTNGSLATWQAPAEADPAVAAALRAYLDECLALPAWARPADIARAENLFMEYGPLSCTLLFCASLPECYVLPHLSEVLHVAGQLEAHTEHRIRQTAAMVFPVMMKGGLTSPEGGGIAQVLKVRLIHATIRHLILRGAPEAAPAQVAARASPGPRASLHEALRACGWDTARQGLPCNQLELAYTLLTFSSVFLQGMRRLGLPLSEDDERAYLHTWNVAGHVLGIRQELMAHGMAEARAMFDGIQALAAARPPTPDVRPGLGAALMDAMARSIRLPVLRGLPVPMTRWLVGRGTARAVGIDQRVGLLTRVLFFAGLAIVRGIDAIVRLVLPRFSLTRMFTRVVGYHLLTRFLMDQTRPLALPEAVLNPMQETIAAWHHDARAPGWVNALEDHLTAAGPWKAAA